MKLVIDRKRWLNGTDDQDTDSLLLNLEGKMCCLGFYLRACKVKAGDILEEALPLDITLPKKASWLVTNNGKDVSLDCEALTTANDLHKFSFSERKARIKELFAKHDVHVTFK